MQTAFRRVGLESGAFCSCASLLSLSSLSIFATYMNSIFAKALLVFSLCTLSTFCSADALRELIEKATPKEVNLGNTGTRMWTVEQTDPYSATFGQTLVWISMNRATRWRVRNVQMSAKALETFQGNMRYEREVTIQGGFFGETSEGKRYPLGLIISDGKIIGKKARWSSGGVLYAERGRLYAVSCGTQRSHRVAVGLKG